MKNKKTLTADVVIVGASIGGVIAAYQCARSGHSVIMFEYAEWIGGQLTSQAVPPDEHRWIEAQGATATYREFRRKVREHYRNCELLKPEARADEFLNPGQAIVSAIAHEPKVGLGILLDMLRPYTDSGMIRLFLRSKLKGATADDRFVKEVEIKSDGVEYVLKGSYFLDATDCGDLLPLVTRDYVSGAESRAETGETHAAEVGNPLDMQPITYSAAVEFAPEQTECLMNEPEMYRHFKKIIQPLSGKGVLSMYGPSLNHGKARQFGLLEGEKDEFGNGLFPLFPYRRIVYSGHYLDPHSVRDVTMVNWPQNDYYFDNVYDSEDDAYNRYMARQLTLSLVYYMATEAERPDGKRGLRGLNLRPDITGTADGVSQMPYIRESRRIKAIKTITEDMLSKEKHPVATHFEDSVGVGSYHIDLHMTTKTHTHCYYEVQPFEIPLSAMIPLKLENLIPACKNIGTTHLTNGCYRLHPVEWNVGEVAGLLVSYCMDEKVTPRTVYKNKTKLRSFQQLLSDSGIQLSWI